MEISDALFQKFGKDFAAGTLLFREGDVGQEMYVIHAGSVAITKHVRGQDKLLATLRQGEFFGEMAILNNKPRSATATVAEDAKLLVITAKVFEAMMLGSNEIALRMVTRMAARLQEADDLIENLLHRDADSRVVHFLLRYARSFGGTVPYLAEDLPREVGVAVEEIKVVYDKLIKKGLIDVGEEDTKVIDIDKLEQFMGFLDMREQFGD